VEAIVPPIPKSLLPLNGTETRAAAYFDWEDVTDPSLPVIYSLQVASDQNFAAIEVEKTGLTTSEYTLAEAEALPTADQGSPYHWRVKASDSAGNDSDWSTPSHFYVTAPATPILLLPATDNETEKIVRFDWQDIKTLNPPTGYRLQIASDDDFATIVLDKAGLVNSEYTLAEDEELSPVRKDAPYYWRTKAIDSRGNESEWSPPESFYVGFSFTWPGWLVYTFIGMGVLLIGFFAFWAGRRTAYYVEEV